MKPINIKKVLLSFVLAMLASLTSFAQQSLWVGESYKFDVTSSVIGLTANMSWSTSGGYISLSGSGLYRNITVTQYFSGTATVTCEWDYKLTSSGSYTHTKRQVTITCRDNQVSISPASLTMTPGETRYVSYRHQYDNQYTSSSNAYFQSTDPTIASVNQYTGEVTAIKAGTAYINVYSKISSVTPFCKVTVEKVNPTSISIPSSLEMTGGEIKTITPTLYPSNAQSNFYWESSNTSVARISDGTITAIQDGTSTISVRTDNNLSASCKLTVHKGKLSLYSDTPNGWVEKGAKVKLYASQSNATIYYTIDETEPTTSSNVYSSNFTVDKNLIIRAYATCKGFYDSDIETFKFNIRDFVLQKIYPSEEQTVNTVVVPQISFNYPIHLGSNSDNIVFQDNRANKIPYTLHVGENTLFINPAKHLEELKGYTIIIPENSVYTDQGENNKEISLNFNTGSKIINISYGLESAAIVKSDGSLWVWGNSRFGQLGNNSSDGSIVQNPIKIMDNVIDVNMSYQRGMALKSDGSVWSWGRNDSGALGCGNTQNQPSPVKVLNGISKISCCSFTSAAISNSGDLYMWGNNYYGQIGDGSNANATSPKKILSNVNDVSVGQEHTVASVGSNNSIYAWGHNCHKEIFTYNSSGQSVQVKTPCRMSGYFGNKVATTEDNTIFLDNGTVNICGYNYNGIFGNNVRDKYIAQGMIKPISNIKDIKAGQYYILALDNDNSLWGWGDNKYGQIGLGHYNNIYEPYRFFDLNNVEFFTAGYNTAAAILSNGDVYAWGDNKSFQLLGKNNANSVAVPTKIFSGPSEAAINSVRLIYSKNIIGLGERTVCAPIISPIDASISNIEWSSSDDNVATVNDFGIVTGVTEGIVNISAKISGKDGRVWNTSTEIEVNRNASIKEVALNNNYSIYTEGNSIFFVSSFVISQVKIYSLPAGIYIVQVGNACTKVILR